MFVVIGNGEEPGTRATVLPQYIHNDIVFPTGVYQLQYDMIIDPGVSVAFSAGSTIDVFVELTPLTIFAYGNLTLNGYGDAITKSVTFRSIASMPAPGSWNGIHVYGKCNFKAKYANIQHAIVGVTAYKLANTKIESCTFENNSVAGVKIFNEMYPNGTIVAPHDVRIESSRFKENGWGVIENGVGSSIEKCQFIENIEGGILVGNGSHPYSMDLKITDNDFIDNSQVSIQFGNEQETSYGITNTLIDENEFRTSGTSTVESYLDCYLENENMVISRNTFREGYEFPGAIRYCKDLTFRSNELMGDGSNGYHILTFGIINFENCTFLSNSIHNGNTGISASDGNNLTMKYNRFYGAAQSEDNRASLIRCNNVSYAWIHNNYGENNGQIFTYDSAPIWIFNNTFSSRLAQTRYHEDRVILSSTANSDKLDWVYFYDNVVVGTVSCYRMYRVLISNNIIRDSRRDGLVYGYDQTEIDEVLEPSFALVENNTIFNNSRDDISTGSRVSQDKMAQYEIIVKNSTFDHEKVMMEWNYSIKACWYMNVRTINENSTPMNSNMNVENSSGEYDKDHQLTGEWELIQGPFMSFSRGERWWYDGVDPEYGDVMCNLTFTAEDRMWGTAVNWSHYLEMDMILDASPEFNDPGTVHFEEDTAFEFDINDHFQDLDEIVIEILDTDGNLNFTEGYVETTNENWFGTSNVTFRATDTFGNFTDGTVSFIVDPENDAPAIHPEIGDIRMDEDTVFILELAEYMFDVEEDPLEWTVVAGENITVELDNATWNLTIIPYPDWSGNTSITLYLNDTRLESEEIIGINVQPVNDAPVFDTPENWNATIPRGQLTKIDLLPMVTDVENDVIGFSMDIVSEFLTLVDGELVILFPEDTETTLLTVVITASDGNGGEVSRTLLLILEEPEEQPEDKWDIRSTSVTLSGEGWDIDVTGLPGLDVYIVISKDKSEIGTYRLEEDQQHPGNYSLTLGSEGFEEGEIYTYYFTDREGGEELWESMTTSPFPGTTDVEEEFVPSIFGIVALVCIGVFVLMLLLVVIIFIVSRRRKDEPFEE